MSCSRTQHSASGEAQSRDPLIHSLTLYQPSHCTPHMRLLPHCLTPSGTHSKISVLYTLTTSGTRGDYVAPLKYDNDLWEGTQ